MNVFILYKIIYVPNSDKKDVLLLGVYDNKKDAEFYYAIENSFDKIINRDITLQKTYLEEIELNCYYGIDLTDKGETNGKI